MSSEVSFSHGGGNRDKRIRRPMSPLEEVKEASEHYLDKWNASKRTEDDLASILPGNKITMNVFRHSVEGEFSDKSCESLLPSRYIKALFDDDHDDDGEAFEAIAKHFVSEDGERKDIYILCPYSDTPMWMVVAHLQDSKCVVRFHAPFDQQKPSWINNLIQRVKSFLRGGPFSFTYRTKSGPFIFDDDVDLALFQITRDTVKDRQGQEGSQSYVTMDEFRVCCFWRYVVEDFRLEWFQAAFGEPEAPLNEHDSAENEDEESEEEGGYSGEEYDDHYLDDGEEEDDDDDDDDNYYQYRSSVKKRKQKRKPKNHDSISEATLEANHGIKVGLLSPTPKVRDIMDDWFEDDAGVEHPEDEEDDDGQQYEFDKIVKGLDFQRIIDHMATLDPDDSTIDSIISNALEPHGLQGLRITPEIKASIISGLPDNQASIDVMEADPQIRNAVNTFKMRLGDLIKSQATMSLAIYHVTNKKPGIMKVFVMFCIANADQKSRDLLLDIFTHPSITPIHVQYILGQDVWAADMFDEIPRLGFDAINRFVTTYIGVAHVSGSIVYFYCGSATSLLPRANRIGEARRMKHHYMTMDRGEEEIIRRRREGDHACLYIHEKMGQSNGNWFFVPLFRFSINSDDPSSIAKSALAYMGENMAMVFLGTGKKEPVTRKMNLTLRSSSLPDPPWNGSNLVLPMLQASRPMWHMLRGRVTKRVERTPDLMNCLREHYNNTNQPWVSVVTCRRILQENSQDTGETNYKTLQTFYSEVLAEHGMQYQNMHQIYLRRLAILYVAIIGEVEAAGNATFDEATQRYGFSATDLNWEGVSARAQALLGEEEEDAADYSVGKCQWEYSQNYHNLYFHQQVLNKPNWETLRNGNLKLISSDRIARVKTLFVPVLSRLKDDVGLDQAIQVQPGAWEDESLKGTIFTQLWKQYHKYRVGVPQSTAQGWAEFEELGGNWADPPPSDAVSNYTLETEQQQGAVGGVSEQPLHIRDKVKTNLEKLMSCHVMPASSPIRHETKDSSIQDATADADVEADRSDVDGFELLGVDGQTTRGQLFSIKSKHQRPKRKAYARSGTTKKWIDNK
ncbi:hypothetical protein FLONG3_11109 [Fusarium longipes]|uniref:Uncharacterized protein n=1 Tax=Fusarium longipes TaxID=694270 RepID=A0A395RHZ5_9HYPO|nr:hypothetical protein FLONG3_11109 [Fusarium longipes]